MHTIYQTWGRYFVYLYLLYTFFEVSVSRYFCSKLKVSVSRYSGDVSEFSDTFRYISGTMYITYFVITHSLE